MYEKKNKEKKTHEEDEYFLVQRELEIKMYYFNYTQKCVIKIEHNFYLLFFFLYSSLKTQTQTQIVAIATSLNDRII